jgi:hypothetical protein
VRDEYELSLVADDDLAEMSATHQARIGLRRAIEREGPVDHRMHRNRDIVYYLNGVQLYTPERPL